MKEQANVYMCFLCGDNLVTQGAQQVCNNTDYKGTGFNCPSYGIPQGEING